MPLFGDWAHAMQRAGAYAVFVGGCSPDANKLCNAKFRGSCMSYRALGKSIFVMHIVARERYFMNILVERWP
jgi:hypothetical protein